MTQLSRIKTRSVAAMGDSCVIPGEPPDFAQDKRERGPGSKMLRPRGYELGSRPSPGRPPMRHPGRA
jgi:hypothetical protein